MVRDGTKFASCRETRLSSMGMPDGFVKCRASWLPAEDGISVDFFSGHCAEEWGRPDSSALRGVA